MKHMTLGQTDLTVSAICLGSMTWGSQNTAEEGHAQLDMARDHGIDFVDTAEMYPTNPVRGETIGDTERVIGDWLALRGGRDRVTIATKVSGEGQRLVRDGAPVTGDIMQAAVEGSLKRLRTDYIDLYQLHWPNRGSFQFRKNWTYDPRGQDKSETMAHIADMLDAADRLVKAGKIRHFALSNESAWGLAQWLRVSEDRALPRVPTVQNEYSLLCRMYDTDMAELAVNERVTLLAFSPLANGLLTGKYAGDVIPDGTRRIANPTLGGRITPRVFEAVSAYLGIAARHGLDPAEMAIAWLWTRPFPVVPIIGATTTAQLSTLIRSAELQLSDEVLAEIAGAHRAHPMPY